MKSPKITTLLIDLFIQNILLMTIIGGGAITLYREVFDIYNKEASAWAILGMFLLGIYQILSGTVLGAKLNDNNRKVYVKFSLLYLFFHIGTSLFRNYFSHEVLRINPSFIEDMSFLIQGQFLIVSVLIGIFYEAYSIKFLLDQTKGVYTSDII